MKCFIACVTLALCAASAAAIDTEDPVEMGDARFGFVTLGNGGDITLNFNATSIANTVIFIIAAAILVLVVLPLLEGEDSASGYGAPATGYEEPTGYGAPARYQLVKKAGLAFGPIMNMISNAYEAYH